MKQQPVKVSMLVFLLAGSMANAQKGIRGMVKAEQSFASFTASHTIKEGFLQFMDSNGIVFNNGISLNAMEVYQQAKAGKAILSWKPVFAVMSFSGDLGVTSGPFEVRPSSLKDPVSSRGSFSSVWRINKEGFWKNMVDLGVSYQANYTAPRRIQEIILQSPNRTRATGLENVLELDRQFNNSIREKNLAKLLSFIPSDSWLNMKGETPFSGEKLITNVLLHIPEGIILTPMSGGISIAGDLAYVYGSVVNRERTENYLRVWINRNNEWQVILQTIKW
jgi:hypothetical protein